MRRFSLALALLLVLPAAASAAPGAAKSGSARATVTGGGATLTNGRITRAWTNGSGGVVTKKLQAPGRPNWSTNSSPDFTLDLNGFSTSSTSGWTLTKVTARKERKDASRPSRTLGVQLVFDYELDPVGLITLERTYTLRPGSAVIGVTSVVHNGSPAPLRIASYSLDELTSKAKVSAGVLTYHGGSDWRDDYRVATREAGDFDDEAEVARFD